MNMNNQPIISCPSCGAQDTWHSENSFKPFCSDRCKLVDLGEWVKETRKIPGDPLAPDALPNSYPDENDL
jgi:uncharacterized protein